MQILTKRTFGGAAIVIAATLGACALFGPRKPPVYEPFTTPSGVIVQDLTVPKEMAVIEPGQKVTMHLIVTLEDGTSIENTEDSGQPLEFVRGQEALLPLPPTFVTGFSEGLEGLRDRARRSLRVPPEVGFGAGGIPGQVPPDSTLLITIEVLGVGAPSE